MSEIVIEPARPEDVPAVMRLLQTANMHYIPSAEMPELDWRKYFVARDEGRLVGFSGYTVLPDGSGKTTLMVVDPASRKHGIGRRLQERRLLAMAAKGCRKVITNADLPETIEWYKKHFGYRQVGILAKAHEFGSPAIDHWTTLEMDLDTWISSRARASSRRPTAVLYPIWCLKPMPVRECIDKIAAAGFDGVSFIAAPIDDPRRLDTLSATDAQAARRALADAGMERTAHIFSDSYFAGMKERNDAAVERAQESIEGCVRALTGPEALPLTITLDPVCLPGGAGVPNPPLTVEMLRFLRALSERHPVRPAMENWAKPEFGTPEAMREILAKAGEGLGVLLDAGHLNMVLNKPWCRHRTPGDFIRALPAPVREIHLHDNHGEGDEHLPPGAGTADLTAILAEAMSGGFSGPVTLESDLEAPGRPGLAAGLALTRWICDEAACRAHERA